MRTAGMVLGLIGGVLGVFAGLLVLLLGGVVGAFGARDASTVAGLGYAVFFVAVIAIVGGALAKAKPVAGGVLMLLTGIGGFICVSMFWLLSGPLLLVGALLAFIGAFTKPDPVPVQLAPSYEQTAFLSQPQVMGYDAHGRPVSVHP